MDNLLKNEENMSIFEKVQNWHQERNLIFEDNLKTQVLKLFEELGEFFSNGSKEEKIDAIGDSLVCVSSCCDILKLTTGNEISLSLLIENKKEFSGSKSYLLIVKDISQSTLKRRFPELMDLLQELVNLLDEETKRWSLPALEECLEIAYNEIKNRTGRIVNGNFIKHSDL